MEEGSRKAEKEIKRKSKEKGKGKKKGKGKGKEKTRKIQNKREIKPGEIEFDWGKIYAPYASCSLKADIVRVSSLVTRASQMLWLDRDLKTILQISIFWTTQKMTKVTKVAKSDPLSSILSRVLVILFLLMILKALASIW